MKKKPTGPIRMSYENYSFIRQLIEKDIDKLEADYHTACRFIPSEPFNSKKPSGLDKAHRIFSDALALRRKWVNELHAAVQASYKDHPDPEMRKFWRLE